MERQEDYFDIFFPELSKPLIDQFIEEVCEICYDKYTKTKTEAFRPALICYQCWYQHVKTNLFKISYMVGSSIISPFESEDQIDVCIALNGLNQSHKQQLEEFLFKKYTTFTKDIEKCPSETCDFAYIQSKCKWSTNHTCPKCQTTLMTSKSFTLKSVLESIYFIFLANKCPKCEIPIERISGCPHMTCPCGHEFCWFCLKDHAIKDNNMYSIHEPKECASIFFSKLIILVTCLLSLSCFLVGGETLRWIMDGFFNFLGYLIHSIILDIFLYSLWELYRHYKMPNTRLPFSEDPQILFKLRIGIIVSLAIIFIFLFLFQILETTLIIIVIELGLIGTVSLLVYVVIYSADTWFDFIY